MKNWADIWITIPTLNPPKELIDYVFQLNSVGFSHILIVNDGSSPEYNTIFEILSQNPTCTIIHHSVNLGKGRALKDAIDYYLNLSFENKAYGIITVDSDGQHIIEDVVRIAKQLYANSNSLILGCRDFSKNDLSKVPFKSQFGNKTTTCIFHLLFGKKIQDTQTGLRGIPESLMSQIVDLTGERFEYETNMLIYAVKHNISIIEVTIKTVYMNNNEETHFRPIVDSLKIYSAIFNTFIKYTLTSISSFLIDILLFHLCILILSNQTGSLRIAVATILARICSSLYNFYINKTIIFKKTNNSTAKCMLRYYFLCIIQMCISAFMVSVVYAASSIPETLIKIVVDTILFFFSFRIQQAWVFKD